MKYVTKILIPSDKDSITYDHTVQPAIRFQFNFEMSDFLTREMGVLTNNIEPIFDFVHSVWLYIA